MVCVEDKGNPSSLMSLCQPFKEWHYCPDYEAIKLAIFNKKFLFLRQDFAGPLRVSLKHESIGL